MANLVRRHSEAIDIRTLISDTILHLLRRHVLECARRGIPVQGCSWWESLVRAYSR
jgi:hypothetical protein